MSLKRNIFASYASQIYATLIGIVMLPVFLRYMGSEAYGLVAFFAMLQVWFLLLGMGLAPAMAREAARYHGGAIDALSLRLLLRSLEMVFLSVAMIGGAALVFSADLIAARWLKVEQLDFSEVVTAIKLMAIMIIMRWMFELYRSVVTGFEQLVWLGAFGAATATTRFVLVLPLFIWIGIGVREFFIFQLLISTLETLVLMRKAYALLPAVPPGSSRWSLAPLRNVLEFSLMMTVASVVWVIVSHADKLLLSGLLSLAEYGWFSLTVLAASGVSMLAGPIAAALLPRLSSLHAQGDEVALIALYRSATQWVGLAIWPASGVLAVQAETILWIWTGDAQLAKHGASTLALYALGNGVMIINALPYDLQFAKGKLRLHLLGTALFICGLVPCMIFSATRFGALGAGWTWLLVNIIYFVVWTPVVHSRYAPGLHTKWLLRDIAPIVTIAFGTALFSLWLYWPSERLLAGIQLLLLSIFVVTASGVGSTWFRAELRSIWHRRNFKKNPIRLK